MAKTLRYWVIYYIYKIFFLCDIKIDVYGLDNIPKNEGYIIAANHDHTWDPVVICYAFKEIVHFMSIDTNFKKTLSKMKWLSKLERFIFRDSFTGFFFRVNQQIPVSYKDKFINKNAMLTASNYIKKREIIGIFPEGVIELRKKIIFPGVAVLAKRTNSKIVPVYVWNNATSDSNLKPNFSKAIVKIGKPLKFSRSVYTTKKRVMMEIYKLKND